MVDVERLLALLARITERLRTLEDYAGVPAEELTGDRVRMGDLKYTFQTALEACIDAAHHVIAAQGLGVPATNAQAFRTLSTAGLLDFDLATRMAGAVGFRNVLVHGYAEVNDWLVVANLARLGDLAEIVRAFTALLADP